MLRQYDPDVVLCDVKLPRRQRRGDGREDQGGGAVGRSDSADGLRQHPRRRAGHQERSVRLHHQRRRQQQDTPAAEPGRGESPDAAPAGPLRGETLRRTLVRPHHRFVGSSPAGRLTGAQGRRDEHLGPAHRRNRNRQGGLRAGDTPCRSPRQGVVRGGQLFGLLQGAARKRTVRAPRREFHGRLERQERAFRGG